MIDVEKKRVLLINLSWMKEVLMKLYTISLDVPNYRRILTAMDVCQQIFAYDAQIFGVPDALYAIHMDLQKLPQPSYDVIGALELLKNGILLFRVVFIQMRLPIGKVLRLILRIFLPKRQNLN